ncbi:polysaccharide biosynthesis protein [Flavobacterium subsaxonicum]|uniref:hypothetical protein n=1 Tax=Flavobacterium subsaxonicum TaxID=426226 RepID=UPI00041DACD6|nr:hypothetical protein [Flavobacterium subsaxonicum]
MKLKVEGGYFSSVKWGGYSIGISFIRQILLVPAFIHAVGSHEYAFWIVLSSIVLMIRAINLGQLHYSSNLINLGYHKNGTIKDELIVAQGANYIYIILQILLGAVISAPILLSAVSTFPVTYILNTNGHYSLFLLVLAKIVFQYNNMFLLRIFEPLGKIKTTIKYQTIGELFDFVVTVIAIYTTKSIFITSLAIFASNILFTVFTLLYVKSRVPFVIPFFKGVSFIKSFWAVKRSFLLTGSFLVEKVYENGLNILIPSLFVTSILPVFTTSRVISNSVFRVSNAAVIPLMPDIQKQFSLGNPQYIIGRMVSFWKISTFVIITGVTVVLPLIPYIYTKWTGDKLDLNMSIVCYLIMAVSIQNFGMIINEFLKKTNLSKQIFIYNIIKSALTVACLFAFGYTNYSEGLGLALLIGESISLIYMLVIMRAMFSTNLKISVIAKLLLPVVLFCVSLLVYLLLLNYWLFLVFNIFILISFVLMAKNVEANNNLTPGT